MPRAFTAALAYRQCRAFVGYRSSDLEWSPADRGRYVESASRGGAWLPSYGELATPHLIALAARQQPRSPNVSDPIILPGADAS